MPHHSAAVGRRLLQSGLRRAAAHLRQPVRPVRPQAHAADRTDRVRRRQPRWWLHVQPGAAHRGPVSDGTGRRHDIPGDACADLQRLHRAKGTGPRHRLVGRDRGRGHRDGADRGGLAAGALQLGQPPTIGPVAMAVTAILVALVVPASKDPDAAALDIPGLVLSAAAMALLVFTIIEAPAYGWEAGRSLAGFAAAAVLLAAFIAAERRAAHPMLDVRLFRNMRFSAASGAVTVSFFTLLGFIFLMTQYFQFVRGYGPLSTGVHLLPVALSVGAGSVAGTQLAVRAGTKLIVTTGLVATAAFYGWVAATTSATISYNIIAVQMVLYGLGMGLTSAPATESIMGAISRHKAGVGSAVNDSTRLIGGTLGVAVIGSVYASVYASRLTATMPASVPGRAAAIAHQSVGAAYLASGKIAALGHPVLGQALQHASANAFLRGLTVGCLIAGAVAAVGALLAVLFLPAQPARPASAAGGEAETAEAAHEAGTPARPVSA